MIGLQGAQGTGKTTLARKYAELADIPFAQTTTSAVFERLGLSPSADFDFDTRMTVQEAILADQRAVYIAARAQDTEGMGAFIADRTPIDLLSYTVADMKQGAGLTTEQVARFEAYRKACYATLNEFFAAVFTLQPVLPVAANRKGKGESCPTVIAKVDGLIRGLSICEDVECRHFLIPSRVASLEARIRCIDDTMETAQDRHFDRMERDEPVLIH